MAGGRPSKYNPDWCEEIITSFSNGQSIEKFCADHDISVSMFYRYRDKHEEFREALGIGESKRHTFWQNLGMTHINDRTFNTNLYKFLVYWNCGVCEKKEVDATLSQKDDTARAIKQAKDIYV